MDSPFISKNQPLSTLMKDNQTSTPKMFLNKKNLKASDDGSRMLKGKSDPLASLKENTPARPSPAKSFNVFKDPGSCSGPATRCHRAAQTDPSLLDGLLDERLETLKSESKADADSGCSSAIDDLISDEPSENYWKDLAEERRRALKETIDENKLLCSEVEQLKEENRRLSDIAAQAESLVEYLNADDSGTAEDSQQAEDPEETSEESKPCDKDDASASDCVSSNDDSE